MGNKVHRELVDEDYVLSAGETYTIKYDKTRWGSVLLRLKKRCQDKTIKKFKLFVPFLDILMIRQRINEVKRLPLVEEDKQQILRVLAQKEQLTIRQRRDMLQDIATDIQRFKRDYGANPYDPEYIRRLKVLEDFQTNYQNWKLTEHLRGLYIS